MPKNTYVGRAQRLKVDEGPIVGHSNQANLIAASLMREAISEPEPHVDTPDSLIQPGVDLCATRDDAAAAASDQIQGSLTSPAAHSIAQECFAHRDTSEGIGRVCVSLDPHCHPLAADHPGRVWNALYHTMPQQAQPKVFWFYETQFSGSDENTDVETVVAHLTISLPFSRGDGQFADTKCWIGEPEVLKATAQCSALVACIADGGLSWAFGLATADIELRQNLEDGLTETLPSPWMDTP